MAAFRKLSGKQRAEHDDPPPYNIRFDYSDTYLDNEDLKLQLEDQADELHREKFRMCVETDEILKKTKQNADEMLQLKIAIKNRDPYESSNRVLKSADLKRRSSSKQLNTSVSVATEVVSKQSLETNIDTDGETLNESGQEATGETEKKLESKPLNTLTMFLLSLQTFKRQGHQRKEEAHKKSQSQNTELHSKHTAEHGHPRATAPPKGLQMKRPASYHHGERDTHENLRNIHLSDKKEDLQYGIHVKKRFYQISAEA